MAATAVTRRLGFCMAHPGQVVRDLALQVGEVDMVGIDQREMADAGAAQVQRHRRAEAAGADDERTRTQQTLLAFDADLVEQDVARITQQLRVVHRPSIPWWPAYHWRAMSTPPDTRFERWRDLVLASVPVLAAESAQRALEQLQGSALSNAVAGDRQHTGVLLPLLRPGPQGLAAALSAALRQQLREEFARVPSADAASRTRRRGADRPVDPGGRPADRRGHRGRARHPARRHRGRGRAA